MIVHAPGFNCPFIKDCESDPAASHANCIFEQNRTEYMDYLLKVHEHD